MYGFVFEYNNDFGDHYIFKNANGHIEFYEWPEFDESEIIVKYNMISKKVNLIVEYPKIVGKFNQNHKGIKWLFKDFRNDYWKMIAEIFTIEIAKKHAIFGLAV